MNTDFEEVGARAHSDLARFLAERGFRAVPLTCNAVGHFELSALIDGAPVHLLLDTGASHTVLDQSSAKRLTLATQEAREQASGVGTATQRVESAAVHHFALEGMELGPTSLFVIDLSHVNQSLRARGGTPIDGALGGDILRLREAIIDYARSTLYLREVSGSTRSGAMAGTLARTAEGDGE